MDKVTWQDYAADLERNLECLHARVHRAASTGYGSTSRYRVQRMARQVAQGRSSMIGQINLDTTCAEGAAGHKRSYSESYEPDLWRPHALFRYEILKTHLITAMFALKTANLIYSSRVVENRLD